MFRRSSQWLRICTLMLVAVMLLAACGGDDDDDPTETPAQTGATATTAAAATTPDDTADATATTGAAAESTATTGEAAEDDGETIVLNFDAGTTAGGGGRPNAPLTAYCYLINGGSMFEVFRLVDSRLLAFTADMSDYVAEIAESWEMEGTTITFHLRENAMWHDGTPITADDVLFTFNLVAHPETVSRYAATFSTVEGYEELQSGAAETMSGLTAPDDHTVVLSLTQPDSGILPGIPILGILPAHILGDVPPAEICENSYWIDGRVSSGPFKWKELVEGQRIELEAFDDYFLGRPQIDEINLLFFANFETSLAAFEQQSNMAAPLTADNLEYAQGLDFGRIESMSTGVLAIFPNTDMPEFADPRIRQAMAYAIDNEAIADALFKGVAAEPTSRNLPWLEWADSPDLIDYNYDPELAQQLLDEVGWDPSKEFTLWYYYPDQVSTAVVEAIQQYWAAVGINVDIRLDEGGARQAAIDDGTLALTYGAWGSNPPVAMETVWTCAAAGYGYPCIEEYDDLLAQARATFDEEEQQELYRQAVALQNELLPTVFLWNRLNLLIVNNKLDTGEHGAWAAGNLMYHNFAEEWTLEE